MNQINSMPECSEEKDVHSTSTFSTWSRLQTSQFWWLDFNIPAFVSCMLSLFAHVFLYKMSLYLIYVNLLLNCLVGFGESIFVAFGLLI